MDVNILLFPEFETLDVFGPIEVLGHIKKYSLHYFSLNGGIIKSRQNGLVVTEPIEKADELGIILIPGGQGTRSLINDGEFIKQLEKYAASATYCLTVCTGSALLAMTSLLNGKKATSNKKAFAWVQGINSNVKWMRKARWIKDGKYYTSSGVSAGIDMSLGFVADQFGYTMAMDIAKSIEYLWNSDKDNDPFTENGH